MPEHTDANERYFEAELRAIELSPYTFEKMREITDGELGQPGLSNYHLILYPGIFQSRPL